MSRSKVNITSLKPLGSMPEAGVGAAGEAQPESPAANGCGNPRRKELWSVLGDLPWTHRPPAPRLLSTEQHDGYTLERLLLDLNGEDDVPAVLLIPGERQARAPGMLYIHSHGGLYDLGKEQLLTGIPVQPTYAPVLAKKGIVTLAIDSWCFGERKRVGDGRTGEEDAFKRMLWKGQVLFGMMMFDELRALDYLASRPEVDAQRLGVFGMSMGATKAWWLAALDPRVSVCMDVCCLTDFEELIRADGLKGHGRLFRAPAATALPDGRDQRVDRPATASQREWAIRPADSAHRRGEGQGQPASALSQTRTRARLRDQTL